MNTHHLEGKPEAVNSLGAFGDESGDDRGQGAPLPMQEWFETFDFCPFCPQWAILHL
jgi:hypothetical protein